METPSQGTSRLRQACGGGWWPVCLELSEGGTKCYTRQWKLSQGHVLEDKVRALERVIRRLENHERVCNRRDMIWYLFLKEHSDSSMTK